MSSSMTPTVISGENKNGNRGIRAGRKSSWPRSSVLAASKPPIKLSINLNAVSFYRKWTSLHASELSCVSYLDRKTFGTQFLFLLPSRKLTWSDAFLSLHWISRWCSHCCYRFGVCSFSWFLDVIIYAVFLFNREYAWSSAALFNWISFIKWKYRQKILMPKYLPLVFSLEK